MGIEKIGYQGEPFSEITLEIVSELSEFGLPICIDGGMYDESILASLASGADMCVVGSAIGLGAPGAKENYKYLSSLE
jgi:pentose-5-phosphate-3-epimerase